MWSSELAGSHPLVQVVVLQRPRAALGTASQPKPRAPEAFLPFSLTGAQVAATAPRANTSSRMDREMDVPRIVGGAEKDELPDWRVCSLLGLGQ